MMDGRMKTLSAILAVVALIGLVTSGMTVSDVLGSKGYWEEQDKISTANLNKLDDGLNTLKENEQTYRDGVKALADGKQQYEEGKQTLADGYAAYEEGKAKYLNGLQEYAEGKALLESKTDDFNKGKVQKVQAKQVYDAVNELMDGYSHKKAVKTAADATGNDVETVEKGYQNGSPKAYKKNQEDLASAKEAYETINYLMKKKSVKEAAAYAAKAKGDPSLAGSIEDAYNNVKAIKDAKGSVDKASAYVAQAGGSDKDTVKTAYSLIKGILTANGSTDKAATVLGAAAGKDADTIANAYNLVDGILKVQGSEAVAEAVLATAAGKDTADVKTAYDLMNGILSVNGDEDTAEAVLAQAAGKDTSAVKLAYDMMGNALSVNGSEAVAETILGQVTGKGFDAVKAAYDNMCSLLALKGDLANTAAYVASKYSPLTADQVQMIYSLKEEGKTDDEVQQAFGGAINAAQVNAIYTATKAIYNGNESQLAAMIAQQAGGGTTADDVTNAYNAVLLLLDVGTDVNKAASAVATLAGMKGITVTADEVLLVYSYVPQIKAVGTDVDEAAQIVADLATAKGNQTSKDDVLLVYSYVPKLKAVGSDVNEAAQIVADLATAKGNTTTQAEVLMAYGYVGKIKAVAKSDDKLTDAGKIVAELAKIKDPSSTATAKDAITAYTAVKSVLDADGSTSKAAAFVAAAAKAQGKNTSAEEVKAAYLGVRNLVNGYTKKVAVATVANATGNSRATINKAYSMGDPKSQKEQKNLLEQAKTAYEGVKELEDGYSYDKAIETVAKATGNDKDTIELGYENGDAKSQAAIQAQLDEYTNGLKKLQAAKIQLDAAPGQLADAEKQLADGEKALKDAEKQLADGEAQLAQYEDGVVQVKDGLQQAVDTEADPGLVSVAERLGDGFTYLDANGDIDFAKGAEVVDAAWDYKADDGDAITTELYTRVGGAVSALVGSLAALIAAFLAFKKKYKGALPCAAIAAAGAGIAAALAGKAGMYFSNMSGSTMGSAALIAGAALGVVALVHAIADGSAAKAK